MKQDDIRASRFADYRAIYRRALELVNRGSSVNEALSGAARELYPYTHRDIEPILREMFAETKRNNNWGDLRALRDLSEKNVTGGENDDAEPSRTDAFEESMANLKEVFRSAHRKAAAGFRPDDALEMACRELYPHTSRKVLRSARKSLERTMEQSRLSPKGALKLLSEGGPD